MIDLLKALTVLGAVGVVCFWVGFRLGRSVEFYYLKSNRKELDE